MAKKKSKKTIEMFGDWVPYQKFTPYWQIKCALIMFLALFLRLNKISLSRFSLLLLKKFDFKL